MGFLGFFTKKTTGSTTSKTYAGKGPLSPAQKRKQEEKSLPMTAKAIDVEQQAAQVAQEEKETPRLTRGPLRPPPTDKPTLAVDTLPQGERTTAFAGGFSTSQGITKPLTPGAPKLIKVTSPDGTRTFWQLTSSKQFIQVDLKGNPILPQHITGELKEQMEKLAQLEGRRQFEQAQRIGLVPQDATYVETGEGWGSIPKGAIKEQIAAITERGKASVELAKQKAQQAAVQEALKNYTSAGGTDIALYLRDHPNNESTLLAAGFSNEQINKAKDYNNQPFVKESELEGWWGKVKTQGGGNLNVVEFQRFLKEHPALAKEGLTIFTGSQKDKAYKKPDISLDQFVAEFMAARNIEPIGVSSIPATREQYEAREMALHQYAMVYGESAMTKSMGQTGLTFLFAPARALYPEVEFKDIRPLEWGIGAAQIALLTAPFATGPLRGTAIAGKLKPGTIKGVKVKIPTIKGIPAEQAPGLLTQADIAKVVIRGGVGGVFTYATVKNWDNMTPGDRMIAVIIDSIIIGSAAQPIASQYWKGRFKSLTGKVIDTSAKGKMPRAAQVNVELGEALRDLAKAIETRNQVLLLNAAERLKLIGTRNPKLLGSPELIRKAQLLLDNPKQYLLLPGGRLKPQSAKIINDGLNANKRFIDIAEKTLRRVKDPTRQKAIEQALQEARRQVKVATKFRPIIEKWPVWPKGKYLPQVVRVTTKALVPKEMRPKPRPKLKLKPKPKESVFPGIKYKVKVTTATGREVAIPIQAFGTMTMAQIARRYRVAEEEIVWAVATSPQAQSALQNLLQIQLRTQQKEQPKPFPVTKPQTLPQPKEEIKTETETETELKDIPIEPNKPVTGLEEQFEKRTIIRSGEVEVKDVKGLPKNPGIVSWKQGIFWVSVLPPYRKGKKSDIIYTRKPPPLARRHHGDPEDTVYTWKGKPPEVLTIDMGAFNASVTKGKSITFTRDKTTPRVVEGSPSIQSSINRRAKRYPKRKPPPSPEELLYRH